MLKPSYFESHCRLCVCVCSNLINVVVTAGKTLANWLLLLLLLLLNVVLHKVGWRERTCRPLLLRYHLFGLFVITTTSRTKNWLALAVATAAVIAAENGERGRGGGAAAG